jgi:hypothetical protein
MFLLGKASCRLLISAGSMLAFIPYTQPVAPNRQPCEHRRHGQADVPTPEALVEMKPGLC